MPIFEWVFHARWGDMDFNAHLRNTAYLDMAADVRMMYFSEDGFSARELERLRLGPVIRRDELDYFREVRLLEPIRANLLVAGLSGDGSRFIICNEFFHGDQGTLLARVISTGGWLDLTRRKLTEPPAELRALLENASRSDNFHVLDSSIRPE